MSLEVRGQPEHEWRLVAPAVEQPAGVAEDLTAAPGALPGPPVRIPLPQEALADLEVGFHREGGVEFVRELPAAGGSIELLDQLVRGVSQHNERIHSVVEQPGGDCQQRDYFQ